MLNGINAPHYFGSPLMRSLESNCGEAVQILHEFGVDFNLNISMGNASTALEKAAKSHPTSNLVSELVHKYQTDINLVDSYGYTIVSGLLCLNKAWRRH